MSDNVDGEVRIATTLDTKDLQKQLDDLKGKIQKSGKDIDAGSKQTNNFAGSLKKVAAGAAGFTAVSVAVKKTVDVLNDCAATYRVQERAEKALEVAARNNPYLNSENVYNLKNFASELQSLSNVGDEVSINIMAQLAAAGRTQAEIIQIMSAAADMAAVTGEDIGSVASQLNATLSGSAGSLGRQIGAIKNLTEEELKSGKAIEIVAKQYKGSASELADTTVQLSNAWGDFKENIGKGWEKATAPVKKFFLEVLTDINTINAAQDKLKETDAAIANNTATLEDYQFKLKSVREELGQVRDLLKEINNSPNNRGYSDTFVDNVRARALELQLLESTTKQLYETELARVQAEKQHNIEAEKNLELEKEKLTRDQQAIEHGKRINADLDKLLNSMRMRAELTGEELDEQEIYNAYIDAYINLINESNGLISENNEMSKTMLARLQAQAEKARAAADAERELTEAEKARAEAESLIDDLLNDDNYMSEFKKQQEKLLEYKKSVDESEVLSEEEKAEKLKEIDEAILQNKKNMYASLMSEIESYTNETVAIAQKAAELMTQAVENQSKIELAELDAKYNKGEISEQEYYDKQLEIKRKAANDEYKIKMFEWTASLMTATANIAEGVAKAIAQGGTMGLITGALVGASGMLQIAAIKAAKPIPPNFWQGGVIGGMHGATMGNDNTYIHARTGEMVLNAMQQRQLWDIANGGARAGDVIVNNTMSNKADARVRLQDNNVFIDILDKHINKGFTDGTFDAGLNAMNARAQGVRLI